MNQFLWGACAAVSATIALLFLKFWTGTRDRLFLMFAGAFAALAVNWAILGLTDPLFEARHFAYLARLAAFALIAFAIISKNRKRSSPPPT